jgi:hypothetical protein
MISAVFQSNWSKGGARGGYQEVVRPFLGARDAPEEPPIIDQAQRKEADAATPPQRNPELQIAQRKNPSRRRYVLSIIL